MSLSIFTGETKLQSSLNLSTFLKRIGILLLFVAIPFIISAQELKITKTGSGTFTVPDGITTLTVEAWGGGGAGGSVDKKRSAGGGGAGGSYVRSDISVTPGQQIQYYVAPQKVSSWDNNGNPSWFQSEGTIYASGGNGGTPGGNNSNGAGGTGSVSTSIGQVIYTGGNGVRGNYSGAAGGAGGGGAGSSGNGSNGSGSSGGAETDLNGGSGGNGPSGSNSGNAGGLYGGGGSGAKNASYYNSSYSGGTGAQGLIIVKWPFLSATPNDLTFGTVAPGNTSNSLNFLLTGQNLSPANGNITVTAPEYFEISLSASTGYASSIQVPYTGRTLSRTIYVRFKPTQISTDYAGDITIQGGSANPTTVAVTGTTIVTYCIPSQQYSPGDYHIQNVTLGSINNTTGALSSPYYFFYNQSTSLKKGIQHTISIKSSGDIWYGYVWNYTYVSVWIDYNQDGVFSSSEKITTLEFGYEGAHSASFTVPGNTINGTTRMRVRSALDLSTIDPCNETGTEGETEDYVITIFENVIVTAVTTPSCTGSQGTGTITATASNGTSPYSYSLNNINYQASNIFTGLSAGNYTLYVKDSEDHTASTSVTITSLPPVLPEPQAIITNTSCTDTPDGAIRITNIPTAIQFNSSQSEYVDLGGSYLNNLSQFTMEGWIKINKSQISGSRVWGLFGQNDAIEFGFMNSTTLQLYTVNGGSMDVSITTSFTDPEKWYHVAAVGTGTSLQVYIDGVLMKSQAGSTSNYGSSSYSSMLGGRIWDADGNYLNGSMLKAGFWSRALSASEIQTLASGLKHYSSSDASLIAGYNFYEGEGNTISPVGTISTEGTLKNTPTWIELFTFQWYKIGTSSFNRTTKNIAELTAGDYLFFAEYPGTCPATGIFTISGVFNNTWTGSISNDWFIAANWTCRVPDIETDATIPTALQRYPVISSGVASCRNLTLANGSSLTNNSELEIAGTILTTGTVNSSNGTVTLKGSNVQVIPAGMFSTNTLKNLKIDNPAGVSLNGTLNVSGYVLASTGNLETNNHLILLSNATRTALIDGSGTGQVTGNVTIQRYLSKGNGYKYFSTPFTNGTVGQFSSYVDLNPDVFPNFYFYKEENDNTGWEPYTNASGSLTPGKGYAANLGTNTAAKTLSFTGTVNNGTIGPVTLYNSGKEFTEGYNLIGNPYPSPINWNAQGWDKTNIDNAIYFFDAAGEDQYTGTYSSFINGVSTGNASNIIPAFQGFFVHVTEGSGITTGSLTFSNQIRVTEQNPVFHKNTPVGPESFIKLSASVNSQQADILAIYFTDFSSRSFEYLGDALKIANTSPIVPDIYAFSEDRKELSINALPYPFKNSEFIDLGFTSRQSGSASIKLIESVNLPTGYTVYLKDNYTGYIQDLNVINEYKFSTEAKSFTDRFSLILSSEKLSQDAFSSSSYNVYAKDGGIFLNLDLAYEQVRVTISDLSGRIITNNTVYGKGEHIIGKFNTTGVFIVSVFTDMGNVSKKVYLK
jgi:hypothetical protein